MDCLRFIRALKTKHCFKTFSKRQLIVIGDTGDMLAQLCEGAGLCRREVSTFDAAPGRSTGGSGASQQSHFLHRRSDRATKSSREPIPKSPALLNCAAQELLQLAFRTLDYFVNL